MKLRYGIRWVTSRLAPQHTAVFWGDEKTAIQALDRTDPAAAAVAGPGGTAVIRVLPAWRAVLIYAAST